MKIETVSEQYERHLRERQHLVVPGRPLPRGSQWVGHDIPGHGSAAARRLRQLARRAASAAAPEVVDENQKSCSDSTVTR